MEQFQGLFLSVFNFLPFIGINPEDTKISTVECKKDFENTTKLKINQQKISKINKFIDDYDCNSLPSDSYRFMEQNGIDSIQLFIR